jgi:hypothetical protein
LFNQSIPFLICFYPLLPAPHRAGYLNQGLSYPPSIITALLGLPSIIPTISGPSDFYYTSRFSCFGILIDYYINSNVPSFLYNNGLPSLVYSHTSIITTINSYSNISSVTTSSTSPYNVYLMYFLFIYIFIILLLFLYLYYTIFFDLTTPSRT